MKKRKLLITVAAFLLIFLSIFPRVVEIINRNQIFLVDQGRDYMAVRNIIENHKLTLIGAEIGSGMAGLQGLFHGPFYFYFLSIPTLLFDGDPYGGLLLMFIFGLLTIATGFILGRKVFGIFGGLIISLLIAVSPPLIAQSRFVWSPHPASLFILLAFYFTYLSYKKRNAHLFLAAFFAGFIYNFEFAIAVPMTISLFLYLIFLMRMQLKKMLFVILGLITAYLPLLLFEYRHGFKAANGMLAYLTSYKVTTFRFDSFAFSHNFLDTFAEQGIFPPIFIATIFVVGILLIFLKEQRTQLKSFIIFLFMLVVNTMIISVFVKTYIFEYYLIHLNFVYIFLFGYLLISSYINQNRALQALLTVLFFVFTVTGSINGIETTIKDVSDYGGMVKIKGKLEAIDSIYQEANGEEFGLLIFTPPVYTYAYDYLIWWHGQKTYNHVPYKEKKGIVYLLIEPEFSKPWTYKGWLETVIKDGEILETKELPSGFIIQKRLMKGET